VMGFRWNSNDRLSILCECEWVLQRVGGVLVFLHDV
jgi:hypothetical protein